MHVPNWLIVTDSPGTGNADSSLKGRFADNGGSAAFTRTTATTQVQALAIA